MCGTIPLVMSEYDDLLVDAFAKRRRVARGLS